MRRGTDFDQLAGALETEDGRRPGRRRVEPLALQEVGPIDAGGPHPDADVGGAEGWTRGVAHDEDALVARLANQDGAHRASRQHGAAKVSTV